MRGWEKLNSLIETLHSLPNVLKDLSAAIRDAAKRQHGENQFANRITAEIRFPREVENAQASSNDKQIRIQRRISLWTALAFISAASGAAFAGWYAFIARDQEHRQLRAYLTVEAVGITKFNGSDPIEGGIRFKNTGQTPAYKVRAIISMDMSDYPRIAGYAPGDKTVERLSAIVGAGGFSEGNPKTARSLTAIEYASVTHGTGAIYVFGKVLYDDAFGKLRCTYFRFFYTGGADGVRADGGMMPAEDGNDADKDCDTRS